MVAETGTIISLKLNWNNIPGPVFIEGDRVSLHVTEREDIEFLKRGVSRPAVRRYMRTFRLPFNEQRYEREIFDEYDSTGDAASFVVRADGERVGSVQLAPIFHEREFANLGVWILPERQGNGYATEALKLLVEYGFSSLRLHRISAETLAPNTASQRVLERVGFRHEGTRTEAGFVDGEYVDKEYYGLVRSNWEQRR